jgi:hypothetical protein
MTRRRAAAASGGAAPKVGCWRGPAYRGTTRAAALRCIAPRPPLILHACPPPAPPGMRKADEGESFFEAQKRELAARAAATREALAKLDPRTRAAMAGHEAGTYVRMRFSGVPCELVTHWEPRRPLLLGGLGQGEDKTGVMRLRFKRHRCGDAPRHAFRPPFHFPLQTQSPRLPRLRLETHSCLPPNAHPLGPLLAPPPPSQRWYPKTLKTRDPLILSAGWRRYQSIPLYALEDHNRRLRAIKYTPQHMHCVAAVHGPFAPPNTGACARGARRAAAGAGSPLLPPLLGGCLCSCLSRLALGHPSSCNPPNMNQSRTPTPPHLTPPPSPRRRRAAGGRRAQPQRRGLAHRRHRRGAGAGGGAAGGEEAQAGWDALQGACWGGKWGPGWLGVGRVQGWPFKVCAGEGGGGGGAAARLSLGPDRRRVGEGRGCATAVLLDPPRSPSWSKTHTIPPNPPPPGAPPHRVCRRHVHQPGGGLQV